MCRLNLRLIISQIVMCSLVLICSCSTSKNGDEYKSANDINSQVINLRVDCLYSDIMDMITVIDEMDDLNDVFYSIFDISRCGMNINENGEGEFPYQLAYSSIIKLITYKDEMIRAAVYGAIVNTSGMKRKKRVGEGSLNLETYKYEVDEVLADEVIEYLINGFKDESKLVRGICVQEIFKLGDLGSRAHDGLMQLLIEAEDGRNWASESGDANDECIEEFRFDMLDEDYIVIIIKAIERIDAYSERDIDIVGKYIDDENVGVRTEIINIIGGIGPCEDGIDLLTSRLEDKDAEIRILSLHWLSRFGYIANRALIKIEEMFYDSHDGAGHGLPEVRYYAVEAYISINEDKDIARNKMIELVAVTDSEEFRAYVEKRIVAL